MTALPAGLHPRGLTWSVLTTHRTVVRIWLGFILVAAAGMVATYFFGEHVKELTAQCGQGIAGCPPEVQEQERAYARLLETGSKGLLYVPAVVAAFAGAALTGREMENGTATLAWTQSVSPQRWLAVKLTLSAALVAGGVALLTVLHRWVWVSAAPAGQAGWQQEDVFAATGPVGTAYALVALATGALAGLVVRRTLGSLALGVVATVSVQVVGHLYRAKLWPTETMTGYHALRGVSDPMILDQGYLTPSGEEFSFAGCFAADPMQGHQECVEKYDLERYVVFHPLSHYWPLQLVETGIVLALAAALAATAFWLLRRRLP